MCAKITLVIFSLVCFVICHEAQERREEPVRCLIDGKDVYILEGSLGGISGPRVNDTFKGPLTTFATSGIKDVKVRESKWLSFTFDKNTISVVTSEEFPNYEEVAVGNTIEAMMSIKCESGDDYNVSYYQYLNDLNTYPPIWKKKNFVFDMYGTLPINFDLTNFMEVSVTDKDCSPDDIRFSMYHEDGEKEVQEFSIEKSGIEHKTTYARLRTEVEIQPPFKTTYIMKAKDRSDSNYSKETAAMVTIQLKKSDTDFAFSKDEYSIKVVKDQVVSEDPIKILDGLDHDTKVTLVETEFSKFFSVNVDHLTGEIRLQLEKSLPTLAAKTFASRKEFSLVLKASWQKYEMTTTVNVSSDKDLDVVCFVPVMDITAATFDNPTVINDTHEGSVFRLEGIKNVYAMNCAGSDYLQCKYDQGKGTFDVSTTDAFKKYEELETKTTISTYLTVQCPYETRTLQFTQRIRDINNHKPTLASDEISFIFYAEVPQGYKVTWMNKVTAREHDLTTLNCNFTIEGGDEIKVVGNTKEGKVCTAELAVTKAITRGFDRVYTLIVDDGTPDNTDSVEMHLMVVDAAENELKFTQQEYYMQLNSKSKTLSEYEGSAIPSLENGMDEDTQFEVVDKEFADLFRPKANPLTGMLDIQVVSFVVLAENCSALPLTIKATWKGWEAKTALTIVIADDYELPASTSTSTSTSPSASASTSTEVPHDIDVEMVGFTAFLMLSLIGIMLVFVTSTIILGGMTYLITRRFRIWRVKVPVSKTHKHPNLPL